MTSVRELLDEAGSRASAGGVDEALAAYAAVLAHSPQLVELHYNVAALRLRKGDLAGAEASLDETLRLKPDWPQVFLGLGHLYFRQGRFKDAERAFDRAAALAPESVEALFNQAQALDRLRGWAENTSRSPAAWRRTHRGARRSRQRSRRGCRNRGSPTSIAIPARSKRPTSVPLRSSAPL